LARIRVAGPLSGQILAARQNRSRSSLTGMENGIIVRKAPSPPWERAAKGRMRAVEMALFYVTCPHLFVRPPYPRRQGARCQLSSLFPFSKQKTRFQELRLRFKTEDCVLKGKTPFQNRGLRFKRKGSDSKPRTPFRNRRLQSKTEDCVSNRKTRFQNGKLGFKSGDSVSKPKTAY